MCPWLSVFKYDEQPPFRVEGEKQVEKYQPDLQIGQRVLLKVVDAPKLSPQFEDKGLSVHSIEGNHIYTLADSAGKVLKVMCRRERLKPVPNDRHFTYLHIRQSSWYFVLEGGVWPKGRYPLLNHTSIFFNINFLTISNKNHLKFLNHI
jgi:hypothetical protein